MWNGLTKHSEVPCTLSWMLSCFSHVFLTAWGDFAGEVRPQQPFDSHAFPSFSFGKNVFSVPYFLFIAPFSSDPAPSMPPPGAVKVQLSLSALHYPALGVSRAGAEKQRSGKKKKGKYGMIFKHFWEAVGVVRDYLNRCYPSLISALLSSTSFIKCKKKLNIPERSATHTVYCKKQGTRQFVCRVKPVYW